MLNTVQQQKTNYLFDILDKSGDGKLKQEDFKALFAGLITDGDEAKAKNANKKRVEITGNQTDQNGRDRQHAARRHLIKEPSAQQNKVDQVLKGHHAREAGRDVFAHGMTDHRGGLHAP